MNRLRVWRQNFNWRILVVRLLVNLLALVFTVAVIPNIYFATRSVGALLLLALMLGLLNTFVKPIIEFLTLRFIFATAGLVLAVINGLLLWLLARLFPDLLQIDSILSALLGGLVLGLASAFTEALLGLNPPIVSEKYPEIRQKVKDRQFYRSRMTSRMQPKLARSVTETATVEDLTLNAPQAPAGGMQPAGPEAQTAIKPGPAAQGARAPVATSQVAPTPDEDESSLSPTSTEPED